MSPKFLIPLFWLFACSLLTAQNKPSFADPDVVLKKAKQCYSEEQWSCWTPSIPTILCFLRLSSLKTQPFLPKKIMKKCLNQAKPMESMTWVNLIFPLKFMRACPWCAWTDTMRPSPFLRHCLKVTPKAIWHVTTWAIATSNWTIRKKRAGFTCKASG